MQILLANSGRLDLRYYTQIQHLAISARYCTNKVVSFVFKQMEGQPSIIELALRV